jgi:hypothetical protein
MKRLCLIGLVLLSVAAAAGDDAVHWRMWPRFQDCMTGPEKASACVGPYGTNYGPPFDWDYDDDVDLRDFAQVQNDWHVLCKMDPAPPLP